MNNKIKNWFQHLKENKELSTAISILNKLNNKGYKAYLVGGCVRDLILNLENHDIDIATNTPIDILNELFETYDIGQSKSFGIVVVKQDDFTFEIAQFRTDGNYDGRRPDSIQITSSFKQDVNRRDFTINSMGINSKGEIIDYFNGVNDIKNKILKTVGNPYERFREDYLRILRLARFASKFNFKINNSTKKAAQKLSYNINNLSVERIKDELFKAAYQGGFKFARYIQILDELKLLRFILPEVKNLQYYKENLHHHPETRKYNGSVYGHVIECLKVSDTKDPIKNMAILLHDIGKGVTLTHENGLPRYLGHDEKSVDLLNDICYRFKMSIKETKTLEFAVGNHMRFHNLLNMRPSKIYKLLSDENWDVLVNVAKADEFSRGETFKHYGSFNEIILKAEEIKNRFFEKEINKKPKIVDGNRVRELLNLQPGPVVGKIIKISTDYIIDNNVDIKDREKIDEIILKFGNLKVWKFI